MPGERMWVGVDGGDDQKRIVYGIPVKKNSARGPGGFEPSAPGFSLIVRTVCQAGFSVA